MKTTIKLIFQGLSSGGIRLLSGILHSHLASRKMRLRHLRPINGTDAFEELPMIMADEGYDFNFQSSREPRLEGLLQKLR